jgi:hypothetical protein
MLGHVVSKCRKTNPQLRLAFSDILEKGSTLMGDPSQSVSQVSIAISTSGFSTNSLTALWKKSKIQNFKKAPNLGSLTPAAVAT